MKKVLIVEDYQERIDYISKLLIGFDITFTKNMKDGISLLKQNNYDIVFLDHDIDKSTITGTDLSKEWYKNKENFACKNPLIIIHSMNIEKAAIMENYLKSVSKKIERIPFKFLNYDVLRKLNIL